MSYLDILRRVEQGKRHMPDSEGPQSVNSASTGTKKEESLPSVREGGPVYFETMAGELLGPARVSHLTSATDTQGKEWAWFCLDYQGTWRWIREDRLRNGKAAG